MNYYPHHIGDFIRDTSNLTDVQLAAYLRMIWAYYLSEKPFTDAPEDIAFAVRSDEKTVQLLLKHYFVEVDGAWHHKRIDKEIVAFKTKGEKRRDAANARWSNANALQEKSNSKKNHANQEPITNNQIEREKTARATRMPADMEMPDEWGEWCEQNRPDLVPREVFEKFKDHWIAKPGKAGTKLDWLATWRNWVREERQQQIHRPSMQPRESFSERDERRARERYEEMTGKKSSTVIDITPAQLRVTA